jgi:hypothetical protein
MTDLSNEYIPDPEAESEWVVAAFLDAIRPRVAECMPFQQFVEAVQAEQNALETAHQDWIVDKQAKYNLKTSTFVLATYRLLQDKIPKDELLEIIHEAFTRPLRDVVRACTAQILDNSPDPFHAIVEMSKEREVHFFGKSFMFERIHDDEYAYYVDVTRCLWHSFFMANGVPELTRIFCDFDANWIGAIDSSKHGFCFGRVTTLGYGGALCPFHFFRLQSQSTPRS